MYVCGWSKVRKMTTIAIMQPTFMPWLGYFDLIDQVDYFVYLDTVEFSKQSWQQRNKIKTSNGPVWVSVPVSGSKGSKALLKDVEICNIELFQKNINKIKHSYAKAKYANDNLPWISNWLSSLDAKAKLADINVEFIELVCQKLPILTSRYRASEISHENSRHGRLIDICKHFGADTYLSPQGALDYLVEDRAYFAKENIDIVFHEYQNTNYQQIFGEFIPYMSVIDLILNEGEAAYAIIHQGRSQPVKLDNLILRKTRNSA